MLLPRTTSSRQYTGRAITTGYGGCIPCNFRRSAAFIDKIFKGAAPGELPVELPTRLSLVINLKTATRVGLTIPPTLLATPDEVIE